MPGIHPTLTAAHRGLRAAARGGEATPCSAEDLESRLASLHDLATDCVITALSDLIDHLAGALEAVPDLSPERRDLVDIWLGRAAGHLSAVGDDISHARQATGEWTR